MSALTKGSRRRARDARLAKLRAFCTERRWSVFGLHQDLSTGYPVAPLLGARSAQAELALVGEWSGRSALVASVLVRKDTLQRERGPGEHVVHLTTLDSGPLGMQFTAERLDSGLQTAALGVVDPRRLVKVMALLETAAHNGALRVGDRIAASDLQLLMARPLTPGIGGPPLDVEGPLTLLHRLADHLMQAVGTAPPDARLDGNDRHS
jgi:hypothetical protein